jgi:hypothetical protein
MLSVHCPKVLHQSFEVSSLVFCSDYSTTDLKFALTEFFGTKKLVNVV